jgi:hypothetical protein
MINDISCAVCAILFLQRADHYFLFEIENLFEENIDGENV